MAIFKAKDPVKYEKIKLKNGKIYNPTYDMTIYELALLLPLFNTSIIETEVNFDEYIKENRLEKYFKN